MIVKEGAKITRLAIKKMESAGITEIPIPREELIDRIVLRDVIDPETGEVLLPANEKVTDAFLTKVASSKVERMEVIYMDGIHVISAMRDTLLADKVQSPDEALMEVYQDAPRRAADGGDGQKSLHGDVLQRQALRSLQCPDD